jgi:ribosomal protein S18 acetylase RimI-like enzyme
VGTQADWPTDARRIRPVPAGIVIRAFDVRDTDAVVALWHAAGLTRPWNDPHRDIARKLGSRPDLFLVATRAEGEAEADATTAPLVGTAMAGFDGHRGWLYYLAVAEAARGRGIGAALVGEAERLLTALGCPKLNLMVRSSNAAVLAFYARLGYGRDEVATLGKRLIADG